MLDNGHDSRIIPTVNAPLSRDTGPGPIPDPAGWQFDNSYARLPEVLYVRQAPVPVRRPGLAVLNRSLAAELGLNPDALATPGGTAILTGNRLPAGAAPIAQAYAGHQFGHFTMLGDGRAILLGEHLAPSGQRVDVQFKGSGQTPFSRRGDGRAALGPMLREYIISEAMHGLGIPTTRSLAVTTTGELVTRETPLAGAILTRIAASHIRVGTFEFAARYGDRIALQALADYTIARHFPACAAAGNPYLAWFGAVLESQAQLVAQWMLVGFIHGVMNTDNMALSGETIDYGPCAFMDHYDPATVFSAIDQQGRYAYGQQPNIAQWNLARLAETLLPLFDADQPAAIAAAEAGLETFASHFQRHWLTGMRAKLGLLTDEEDDMELVESLFTWMAEHRADYTNTFAVLSTDGTGDHALRAEAVSPAWTERWRTRLGRQPHAIEAVRTAMRASNPAVIPRNHNVETALAAAVENDSYTALHELLEVLAHPYDHDRDTTAYRHPPPPGSPPYCTTCGT